MAYLLDDAQNVVGWIDYRPETLCPAGADPLVSGVMSMGVRIVGLLWPKRVTLFADPFLTSHAEITRLCLTVADVTILFGV